MRHLLKERGISVIMNLLQKEDSFVKKLIDFFQYAPMAYLCFEIMLTEESLITKRKGHRDFILWYKRSKLFSRIAKSLIKHPNIYSSSVQKLVKVISKLPHSHNLCKNLSGWIPKLLPYLFPMIGDISTSSDAKSIFFGLVKCSKHIKDASQIIIEVLMEACNNKNQFSLLLHSSAPLVIHNTLEFINKFMMKYAIRSIPFFKTGIKRYIGYLFPSSYKEYSPRTYY